MPYFYFNSYDGWCKNRDKLQNKNCLKSVLPLFNPEQNNPLYFRSLLKYSKTPDFKGNTNTSRFYNAGLTQNKTLSSQNRPGSKDALMM